MRLQKEKKLFHGQKKLLRLFHTKDILFLILNISSSKTVLKGPLKDLIKDGFPLSQLRPRQQPILSQNKAISVKNDCSTL